MAVSKTITNTARVIVKEDGFTWITVQVLSTSTAGATFLLTGKFADGTTSDAVTIEAGNSVTLDTKGQYPIECTITAPSGCTISFIGN